MAVTPVSAHHVSGGGPLYERTLVLINADFSHRAIGSPEQQHRVASPQAGVERVMRDRVGEKKDVPQASCVMRRTFTFRVTRIQAASKTRYASIPTNISPWRRPIGQDLCPLFFHSTKHVGLRRFAPGHFLVMDSVNDAELWVLSRSVAVQDKHYPTRSWICLPAGELAVISASTLGTPVCLKTGHLNRITPAQ